MTYIYIELPKFNKKTEELETQFDKWLFVFTWLSKLKSRPKALQERVFQKIFDIANIANFTPMERSQYEISLKIRRDNHNAMEYMRKEATEQGLKQGIEQGIEQGIDIGIDIGIEQGVEKTRVEILKTGLSKGHSLETMADFMNVPLEELEALVRKYNLI
jgi:predicted transposase/invertase (TIGR01784 family)